MMLHAMKRFAEEHPVQFLISLFLVAPLWVIAFGIGVLAEIYCLIFPGAKGPQPDRELQARMRQAEAIINSLDDEEEREFARRAFEIQKRQRIDEILRGGQ